MRAPGLFAFEDRRWIVQLRYDVEAQGRDHMSPRRQREFVEELPRHDPYWLGSFSTRGQMPIFGLFSTTKPCIDQNLLTSLIYL